MAKYKWNITIEETRNLVETSKRVTNYANVAEMVTLIANNKIRSKNNWPPMEKYYK